MTKRLGDACYRVLLASLIAFASGLAQAQSGPIAHWKLDENSGSTTADASGSGNSGTLINSPTWSTGKLGSALTFSGTRYVAAGAPANLADLQTTGLTVAAWIRPVSAGGAGNASIVDKHNNGIGWVFKLNGADQIRFVAPIFTTSSVSRNSTSVLSLNAWQHVAATWTGSATGTNIHLYLNGALADGTAADGAGTLQSDSSTPISIGNRPSDTVTGFDGSIDEVRIYNRVLSASELQVIADATPPSVPTSLTATAASSTQINLDWAAATDNLGVTRYLVDRCTYSTCTNFSQIATPSGSSLANTSGVTAGTTYRYRVRAADANDNRSAYSSIVDVTTPTAGGDTQAPTAPSSLTATPASASQVNLSWTASSDNVAVSGYNIERCLGASCSNYAEIATTTTTTTHADTGLSGGTTYRYRVRARDAVLNYGAYSAVVSAVTPAGDTVPPTIPGNLRTTSVTSTLIVLAWNASTDNVDVTGYLVDRCTGAGCTNFAQFATPSGTTFTNTTGISAGGTWRYRVRARDAANNRSDYSSILSVTTPGGGDTQAPTTPTGFAAGVISSTQINLSWSASTDNVTVTSYWLERCTGASCSTFTKISEPTSTSFSDSGLSASTTYRYRVRAQDASANVSAFSSLASATTSASTPLNPPTALTAVAVSNKEIDIGWTPPNVSAGPAEYLVERCQGSSCTAFNQIGTTGDSVHYDPALAANTTYRYRVRVRDANNNLSGYSSILSVTTLTTPACD